MAYEKRKLITTLVFQLLFLLSKESFGFNLPKFEIPHVNIQNVTSNLPNLSPSNIISKTGDMIANTTKAVTDGISDTIKTGTVFLKNGVTLNCLGIPVNLFAKIIDGFLVDETKVEDVKFYFSTKKKPNYTTVESNNGFNLNGTNYDITKNTYVVVHGFLSSGKESWLADMKDALLKYDNANIIVVDWQKGSNTWNYLSAATSTKIVGEQIAKLFAHIRDSHKNSSIDRSDYGKIHLIGHSLGAHISARAAYGINESQRNRSDAWNVSRITGLDPAQPCFRTADLSLKLTKDKADYVDVIHTNAQNLLALGLGLPDQLGYTDFYPNGGRLQPGCNKINSTFWSFLYLPKSMIDATVCSHGRSHVLFTESILNAVSGNCSLKAHRWDRKIENIQKILESNCHEDICPELGIASIHFFPKNEGTFFVATGDDPPFCRVGEEDKKNIEKILQQLKSWDNSILGHLGNSIFEK